MLDRLLLERWIAQAAERAAGYELVGFEDRCPEELLEGFLDLIHVMNTAPRDDLEIEDFVMTPERFREDEDRWFERGYHGWRLIARRVADGAPAGFTEVAFPPYSESIAWQGATGVKPEHRNLGLGRWLKATMALQLLERKPQLEWVYTDNAFSNGPMLAINNAMGFREVRGYGAWQVATARLAESLAG
jgi:GNAT superfamily N-acetyltransferase